MKAVAVMWAVQTMIDDAIYAAKREQLIALSSECQLLLEDLDSAVQPIIDSCTKEAISVCFYTCSPLQTSHVHAPVIHVCLQII